MVFFLKVSDGVHFLFDIFHLLLLGDLIVPLGYGGRALLLIVLTLYLFLHQLYVELQVLVYQLLLLFHLVIGCVLSVDRRGAGGWCRGQLVVLLW